MYIQLNQELLRQLDNPILRTDSYKLTHWRLMKPGTTKVVSYLESRGGKFDKVIMKGLQPYLFLFQGPVVTEEFIVFAKWFCANHFGFEGAFNEKGWRRMLKVHKGVLPVLIKAVPEGYLVPVLNVLLTIENTDDEFPWIVQFIESVILKIWSNISVCTYSFYCKLAIEQGIKDTGGTPEDYFYRLIDFGYRGVSSEESAGLLGMGHILHSFSSDNVRSILYAMLYYNAPVTCAGSVVASEHSVATPFGLNDEGEIEYINHMLDSVPLNKIVSTVGDSKDIYNFAWLLGNNKAIKARILERTAPFVLRPDSGDPEEVLLKVCNILWDSFGGTYNEGHFKVINPCIRVLQGDGINYESIIQILKTLKSNGFAAENIIFGSGGKLLQAHDRDEQKFAIKCSFSVINGVEVDVEKNPVTAPGKRSKKGLLKLHPSPYGFTTFQSSQMSRESFDSMVDVLVPVFKDGEILKTYTWDEVKENLAKTRKLYKI